MQNPLAPRWSAAVLGLLIGLLPVSASGDAEDPPSRASNRARIDQLIEQLGHEDYFSRQRAEEELAGYSFEAFDALMAATQHQDLEVAARARHLLRMLTVAWATKDDPEEVRGILSDYEAQNAADKVLRMEQLAELSDGQGVAALCRLVRFEQSVLLSKHAALALLRQFSTAEPPSEKICRQIEKHLAESHRPAALWLMTWTAFRRDPAEAVRRWSDLVEQEEAVLARQANQSGRDIVAGLAHLQIRWLKKLDRKDEAVAATRVLIRLESGDPNQLLELLDWLIEQEAWAAIDEMTTRFASVFAGRPVLLYTLADAQLAQDKESAAERAANQAVGVHPGSDDADLRHHAGIARQLEIRGQMRWAIREFRHVVRNGAPGTALVAGVQIHLSELLHDQGQDLQAGEMLEALLAAAEKRPEKTDSPNKPPKAAQPFDLGDDALDLDAETRATLRARMYYIYACHHEGRGKQQKQREMLDKALETDHADVDVLIACHRLPEASPEYRQRIAGLIAEETARLRKNIADEPLLPTWYNQFAWLVGNTGGDLDAALKFSKRSIELQPDYGGYHDTLAHVHFARGEYEKAVEVQTRAAELDPHSGLIARQLGVFKTKLEETKRQNKE